MTNDELLLTATFIGIFVLAIAIFITEITTFKNNKKRELEEKQVLFGYFVSGADMRWTALSKIVVVVSGNYVPGEDWMAEVKRYEGNPIAREDIKELYWENVRLLESKYDDCLEMLAELKRQSKNKRITGNQYTQLQSQLIEMAKDVVERCRVIYQLMKADSEAELKARTTLTTIESPVLSEPSFLRSEERALLNILESPEATRDMKAEAERLLSKWRRLNPEVSPVSSVQESMNQDLLTIKRILEGKELSPND